MTTMTTTMPRLNLAMDDTSLNLTRAEQARVLGQTRTDARCAQLGIPLVEVIGRHGCRSIWSVDALAVHFGVPEPRRRYRRRADDQLVIDALDDVGAGTPYQRVARQLGVAVSTVRRWCRRAGIVRGMRAVEFMP
jgi:hypothetical protein